MRSPYFQIPPYKDGLRADYISGVWVPVNSLTFKDGLQDRQGFMAVVWIAAFVTFIVFSRRANFRPGSWCYDGLLKYVPNFGYFCWKIQPLVITPTVLLHLADAVYMERSRLQRHSVKAFGTVWWLWIIGTFVEGIGAFLRFDEIVQEEEQRKAKVKH